MKENETRKKYVESKDHWRGRAARNAGDRGELYTLCCIIACHP